MMVRISSCPSIFTRLAFSTFRSFPRIARIAWTLESRPCLALPPAVPPSTRKSSVSSLLLLRQSESFPGQTAAFEGILPPGQFAGLCGPPTALGSNESYSKICLGFLWDFPRSRCTEPLVRDCRLNKGLNFDIQQLDLGLAVKLRLGKFDNGQPRGNIMAARAGVLEPAGAGSACRLMVPVASGLESAGARTAWSGLILLAKLKIVSL